MLITHPIDSRGLAYHIINLLGAIVHTYVDFDAAVRAREGDQRIAIYDDVAKTWLTDAPAPIKENDHGA